MAPPIKPLFATVPTKVYSPGKPLFASEAIEVISITEDEIASLSPDLNLSPQQIKVVQFDISQMNMKATSPTFIDDIGMSSQMALTLLSEWTARTATAKLFIDTRSAMTRIHQLTSRGAGSGIGGRIVRLFSRIEETPADSDVSREVDWLRQTSSQRSALAAEITKKLGVAADVKDGLAKGTATCRGLLSKGQAYASMANHVEPRSKSLQLSFVICQQLIGQLENLLGELRQSDIDIKNLNLNLVPAWDVNRSLQP